jgi:hypothetical protein
MKVGLARLGPSVRGGALELAVVRGRLAAPLSDRVAPRCARTWSPRPVR